MKRLRVFTFSKDVAEQILLKSRTLLVAAPSGTGKGTVIKRILELDPMHFCLAISVTTRAPREGEIRGKHYHFVSVEEFEQMINDEEFVEWAKYSGNLYGTLKSEIIQAELDNKIVITEIEAQGVEEIKKHFPGKAKGVVLYPPTEAELMRRLLGRNTDNDRKISERMGIAHDEIYRLLALDLHPVCNRTGEIDTAAKKVIGYALSKLPLTQ